MERYKEQLESKVDRFVEQTTKCQPSLLTRFLLVVHAAD